MRWSRLLVRCALVGLASLLPATPAAGQVVTVLHSFGGYPNGDGQYPKGGLLLSGSALYGMTNEGGAVNAGTIFQVGIDGTGYSITHTFLGGFSTGPEGSLIQSGSTLYGLVSNDTTGHGTIFQVAPDGSGYSVMHTFNGGPNDGSVPWGSLVQSGSTLYGMTVNGGTAGVGTIFQIGTDGTGFSLLHSFTGGPADGANPYGSLIASNSGSNGKNQAGSVLYGMTREGGIPVQNSTASLGTIFRIGADGTGFTLLHLFGSSAGDGQSPIGSLVQSGSTLYGMTSGGGGAGYGEIFSINTDGTLYRVLHSFTANPDGAGPLGSLVVSGSTLYGMTEEGGNGLGTIFEIGTDGTGYSVIHSFVLTDGGVPYGDLLLSGSTMYGMTSDGGAFGHGVVFSFPIPVPEPSSLMLAAAGSSLALLARRRRAGHGGGGPIAD
jgi:uncharacterized repeat protein (TIGR03803 family)